MSYAPRGLGCAALANRRNTSVQMLCCDAAEMANVLGGSEKRAGGFARAAQV
jgi:hypothetical protein